MTPEGRIQELFYEKIPLTRALGVRVEEYAGGRLTLTAPLSANVNHLGTAFGGSLHAVAVLSGYGLLWLELRDLDPHIVIRDSTISYERPVTGDLRAVCQSPGAEELERFRQTFLHKGRARIALDATIEDAGRPAVRFRGTFVALRDRKN